MWDLGHCCFGDRGGLCSVLRGGNGAGIHPGDWDCPGTADPAAEIGNSCSQGSGCTGAAEAELWAELCPAVKCWDQIPGILPAQGSWRGAAQLPESSWSGRACWDTNIYQGSDSHGPGVTLTLTPQSLPQAGILHLGVRLEAFSFHNHGITELGKTL